MGYMLDKFGWSWWTWMIIPFSMAGALLMTRLWNETPLRKKSEQLVEEHRPLVEDEA